MSEQENIIPEFEDGITAEEKTQLAQDLQVLYQTLQTHDRSIFQTIAVINAMQKFLIEKLDISKEEIAEEIEAQAKEIQDKYVETLQKMQEEEKGDD